MSDTIKTNPDSDTIDSDAVYKFLTGFHDELCSKLSNLDGSASFLDDPWTRDEGGGGLTRTLTDGAIFEKAGVAFSRVNGTTLPPSASAHRPELAGRNWEAMGVSLVMHPLNPFIPTTHANVRFFRADKKGEDPVWWFGGGFDLTPYYGFDEDCIHWHQTAHDALSAYDNFDHAFSVMKSVANHFYEAYAPIVERRKSTLYTQKHRDFQLYRRGRYVEFNLVFDRGTLFGLQSGGRTESILMSLPPHVSWVYNFQPEPNSQEEKLTQYYLKTREWLNS